MPLFGEKVRKPWSPRDEARLKRVRLLIRLIPGVGDAAGTLLSAYILYEAIRLGAPPSVLLRMAANIGIDAVVGAIPVAGDLFDVVWKANKKNATLLHAYLAAQRTS